MTVVRQFIAERLPPFAIIAKMMLQIWARSPSANFHTIPLISAPFSLPIPSLLVTPLGHIQISKILTAEIACSRGGTNSGMRRLIQFQSQRYVKTRKSCFDVLETLFFYYQPNLQAWSYESKSLSLCVFFYSLKCKVRRRQGSCCNQLIFPCYQKIRQEHLPIMAF